MQPTLLEYRSDEYSQNGEDGVIGELFNRIDIDSGWFCEFGAWDGKHLSNTYNLIDNSAGWRGVLIEDDPDKYEDLKKTVEDHPDRLHGINSYVSATGDTALDNILDNTEIPTKFELLSIDIDGPDYFIWESVEKYTPKVVIIEINTEWGAGLRFISEMAPNGRFEIDPDATDYPSNFSQDRKGERIRLFGTSFKSMVNLGEQKGYTPVSCTQNNVIFVLDELANDVGLTPEEYTDPTTLFIDEWRHGYLPTPFYKQSIGENYDEIKQSVQNNGFVKTGMLGMSKLIRDIFNR